MRHETGNSWKNQAFFRQALYLLYSKKQPLGYATAAALTYISSSSCSFRTGSSPSTAAAYSSSSSFSIFLNMLVFGLVYVLYSAIYIYNDIVDIDIDKANDSSSSAKHLESYYNEVLRYAKRIVIFLFVIVAFLVSFTCWYIYCSDPDAIDPLQHHCHYPRHLAMLLAIVLASVSLGIIYSHPRIYLKKKFLLKSLSIAIGGGLASLIGWSISKTDLCPVVLLSTFSTSTIIFVMSILYDLRDLRGDQLHNVKTFPIVLGVPASFKVMCCAMVVPILVAVIIAVALDQQIGSILLVISAIVSIIGIKTVLQLNHSNSNDNNNNFENRKTFLNSVVMMRRLYYLSQLGMCLLAIGGSSIITIIIQTH